MIEVLAVQLANISRCNLSLNITFLNKLNEVIVLYRPVTYGCQDVHICSFPLQYINGRQENGVSAVFTTDKFNNIAWIRFLLLLLLQQQITPY